MNIVRYVDAHIHLSDPDYADCVNEVVTEARDTNVVAMVSNAMNLKTCIETMRLVEKNEGLVYATLGIHPWTVQNLADAELQQTIEYIGKQKGHKALVAIGEIGLDSKYDNIMNKQMKVFDTMLHTAETLGLPAVIHSRGTTEKIIEMLPSYGVKKILFHWFSSPIEALPKVIDKGYFITEGPVVAYSAGIQEVIRKTPLANLMTETDGPVRYLKPPFNGKRTTPAYVPMVVKAMAETKGTAVEEVATSVLGNFESFFGVRLN